MYAIYGLPFTINIPQMSAYIPYDWILWACNHNKHPFRPQVPKFPRRRVVHVACGGGQQGCTGAVTLSGELYTFGDVASCGPWGKCWENAGKMLGKIMRKCWENAKMMGLYGDDMGIPAVVIPHIFF